MFIITLRQLRSRLLTVLIAILVLIALCQGLPAAYDFLAAEAERSGIGKALVGGNIGTPLLDRLGERVVLHDHFIPDAEVANYFSVADALVLPYRTATQSGVTQIAYNFSVPMVVTRVGGLPEIVADGVVGFVCEPTAEGVHKAIVQLYEGDALQRFAENFPAERKRFSWATMCDKLVEVYNQTK